MPDRTQTLSVELERGEIEALLRRGDADGWQAGTAEGKLHNALSQPEHQGDEEKEQIEEAFEALAGYVPAGRENLNLKTLRNLTSREHRGEEGLCALLTDEAVRAGAKRQHEGEFEDHFDDLHWDQLPSERQETAAARFRECLKASVEQACGAPLESPNEELAMIALALYNQGIEDCTPERGVELLIERLYAQRRQPPAGEVERLRERLAIAEGGEMGNVIEALARSLGGVAVAQPEWADYEKQKRRLAAAVFAVIDAVIGRRTPPPSDSQGDQERCGGTREIVGPASEGNYPCPGCPDCNPAPTQVEGDVPDEHGVTENDRAVVDDYARQLEGGDEEDRREAKTHELKCEPPFFEDVLEGRKTFEVRKADRNFFAGDILVLREFADGNYTGRSCQRRVSYLLGGPYAVQFGIQPGVVVLALVPATSQDSSEIGRLKYLRKATHVYYEDAQRRAERAETALDEQKAKIAGDVARIHEMDEWIEKEPERQAAVLVELAEELERGIPPSPHDDALELRSGVLLEVASRAREKAAELKEQGGGEGG